VCVLLGFELRAFNLGHSTNPIFVMDFLRDKVSKNYLTGLVSNWDTSDLCLIEWLVLQARATSAQLLIYFLIIKCLSTW
jgi:hypothetical protein